ncbi:hypothetical protein HPB52_025654 [Rhipicephalus sanguineus]|uniref:Secreted protein n=1 Tax=Rhipicephalus sanguineus TaxID=34632 RepID=A0A9D4YRI3_RHISA|nr:hypothetical protein HPB52_025654 [Rhipicephalus sanguineus]
MSNIRLMSPFWCQLVLLATTAVLAELDTSFGFGSSVVPGLLQLLGLSVFVKVVSSICLIFFSNIINLSLPARTDLTTVADVANATAP